MSADDRYSDERLNLFVDNELDGRDRAELLDAIQQDGVLANRVCELMQLKDAVQLAYDNPPRPPESASRRDRSVRADWMSTAVAAMVLLVTGIAGGWLLYPQFHQDMAVATASGAGPSISQQEKIILHISKSDPKQFAAALDYTERFLAEHDNSDQIDVVAHASGLDVMRADVSPVRDRILSLMQKHRNVHFIACAGAIQMYYKEHGAKPVIIEGVGTDMTAFDHIVGRLQSGGWRYIKVESITGI